MIIHPIEGEEFVFDYLFIKFEALDKLIALPWLEVADGKYLYNESDINQFVVLIRSSPGEQKSEASAEDTLQKGFGTKKIVPDEGEKVTFTKKALIKYLEQKLRDQNNPDIVDYGKIQDVAIQPAGQEMVMEVHKFWEKYGNRY